MINHPNRSKSGRSKKTKNTLFPGRPNYTGPKTGIFGLLHHEVLFENSHDVMERVAYVKKRKPENEIAIRLYNMIYLGGCQAAVDYEAKYDTLDADYAAKIDALDADYESDILIYIRSHIPDCAWNGKTLVFDGSAAQCAN